MGIMSRVIQALTLFFFATCFGKLAAQQFTAHPGIIVNSHCNGFYDYLPAGYNPAGAQKYPLLIALHGVGERGDGSTNPSTGLPLLINPNKGMAFIALFRWISFII
jgi:hypothetical protein